MADLNLLTFPKESSKVSVFFENEQPKTINIS